jgi:heme oxygenase-like protein
LTEAPVAEPGTSSARIRQELAGAIGPLTAACTALVGHPRLRELWPEYLVLQHQIIRATVPLTETALDRTRALPESDPLLVPLAAYLEEHVEEELNHDDGLLDDLESLGLPRAEVCARMPSARVAALVGAQYYWIFHYHPVALLGYIAVLEGYPPSMAMIDGLMARTGYTRSAFRTLIAHSELDPGHSDELDELLDRLPITPDQAGVVGLSAISTVTRIARVFEEVAEEYGERT